MTSTSETKEQPMKGHAIESLVLLLLAAILIVLSIALLVRARNPSGVYYFEYTMAADGQKEYGKKTELHLMRDGTAIYVVRGDSDTEERIVGTWEHSGGTVYVSIGGTEGVFEREGDALFERGDDGQVTCYREK